MNLSQKKREQLLTTIRALREQNTDNSILSDLNEIELELNRKKYGLVWEKHEEEVDKMLISNIPVFTEVKEKAIIVDPKEKYNFLLEGDNLHSLKLLEKTHKGKINVIYIDPPYNTKNKDFIYNDNQVGEDDSYRHSKWLSFMAERLEIARELLSDDGVIFISIDDNEQAQLKLLCDSIFGEDFVETNIWSLKDKTESTFQKTAGYRTRKEHEYIIVVFKSRNKKFNKYTEKLNYNGISSNPDNDSRGNWYSGNISRTAIKSRTGSKYYKITTPSGKEYERNWTLSKEEYEQAIKDNRIYFPKAGEGVPRYKIFESDIKETIQSSIFEGVKTSITGKNQLKELFGEVVFNYPKPIDLIKRVITIGYNKNAIVLDFFAGSGTTGHAVELLNKEDGGNRTYILCTNNENGICENITYQRLSKIQEELPHNLKYLKTDFISKENFDMYEELEKHIIEMIELEEGYGSKSESYSIVMNEEKLDVLEKNISNMSKLCTIYKGASALATGSQEELLRNYVVKNIPEYYYEEELEEGKIW